jgi:hypothetical protein
VKINRRAKFTALNYKIVSYTYVKFVNLVGGYPKRLPATKPEGVYT